MTVTLEDVEKMDKLAHIGVHGDMIAKYVKDLNSIVKFFEKLDEIDTSNIDDELHSMDMMFERKDIAIECDESVMNNAPEKLCGMFAVPNVME